MKKSYLYLLLVGIFVIAGGFIIVKYKTDKNSKAATFYPLKDRLGKMANSPEEKSVKKNFASLMKIIGTNPDDTKSRIALASLYIQEARITGNYMYYDVAAMKYVNEVLEKEPNHFDALTYKALLYISQHHFAEGLAIAEKARAVVPENAFVHGILVDGNVEMGNYDAAVDEAEKMISIRPDLRSYSRVSYLREIYGDYTGAIEAMKLAVEAGYPGDEATEWARVHLGQLYEITGDLQNAEMHYLIALERRPEYAYAIAGQGRIAVAKESFDEAIEYFLHADSLVNDYSLKEVVADSYLLAGQKNKSDSIISWLIKAMNNDAQEGKDDETIGHYADKELAHVYFKTGNYDKALEHAFAEYNRRPANIDVNETIAWAYYLKGDYKKALPYLETALKTESKKPELLCRAGLIYSKTPDKEKARNLLGDALAAHATINESLRKEGAIALRSL
ncbi:MAG: tetratricopeptide repeat protein [Chitinophagaceae bacterium]